MAKRKKLNKRVVVVWIALGVILALFAVTVLLRKTPRDPVKYAQKGDDALERAKKAWQAGNAQQAVAAAGDAEKAFAIAADNQPDPKSRAPYLYKQALVQIEILKDRRLTGTERRERWGRLFDLLGKVVQIDEDNKDAQRLLCDLHWDRALAVWQHAERALRILPQFIDQADQMLLIALDDHGALFRRARAKARLAQIDESNPELKDAALVDFREAIKRQPANIGYRLEFIKCVEDTATQEQVLAEYEASVKANSSSAELRVDYANYLRKIGRNEDAMAQINEAIRRDPNNPLGFMSLAQRYESEKQHDRALEALGKAKEVAPTDPRVYGILAQVYKRVGRPEEAVKQVRYGLATAAAKAQKELPQRERTRLLRARAFLNYLLATLLLDEAARTGEKEVRTRNLAEARACLEAISRLAPDNIFQAKIEGHLAFVEGRMMAAIPLLETAMDRLSRSNRKMDAHTASLLVMSYLGAGRPTKAERVLERLLRYKGEENNPTTLFSLAQVHMLMREFQQAEPLVERVLRIDPENRRARNLKVVLEVLLHGRLELLAGDVKVAQSHMDLLRERAEYLWARKNSEPAIRLTESLRTKTPKDPKLTLMLVKMYRESGQPDKAENITRQVAETNPELAEELKFQGQAAAEPDLDKRFEMLIARAEEKVKEPLPKVLAKLRICQLYNRNKDYELYLEQAERLAPKNAKVVPLFFDHALKTGDMAMGDKWAKIAAENNSDGAGGNLYAGRLAIVKKDYKEAVAKLQATLAQWPNSKYVRALLGNCYVALKDHERAEAAYRAVLALDRSHLRAMIGMAKAADLRRNREESDQWVERAYAQPKGRNNSYVRERYLRIAARKDNPVILKEVIYHRERAYRKKPNDLVNALRLGRLYERNRQPGKAEEMYLHVFRRGADKLRAVTPLLGFYAKTAQKSKTLKVFGQLESLVADKVAVSIAVGSVLMNYNPAQAEAAYRSAIEKDPKDRRGLWALARLLARLGRFEAAAEQLEKCLKLKTDDRTVEDSLILYQIKTRKDELMARAAGRLERILTKNALDARALALRGLLASRRGRSDEALRYLNAAVMEAPPSFIQPLSYRAEVYRARGEMMKAKQDLEELRGRTASPDIARSYAQLCQAMGDYKAAEIAYQDALKRRPREPSLLRGLMNLYLKSKQWKNLETLLEEKADLFSGEPAYYLIQYEMRLARGDRTKAIAALESALQVAPENALPGVVRTALLAFLDARLYDKALALCRKYSDKPQYVGWLEGAKARALAGMNKRAEADTAFQAALKKSEGDETRFVFEQMVRAYGSPAASDKLAAWVRGDLAQHLRTAMVLSDVFLQDRQYAKALAELTRARALARTPEELALVTSTAGVVHQKSGNYPQAEKAYREVLKNLPDHLRTLNNIAYLYAEETGRPKDALPYAKRAYDRAPGSAAIVDTYGWTLAKLGRWPEAQEYLAQAVQLDETEGAIRFHLARAHEENQLFELAIKQYQEAVRLAAASKDADLERRARRALDRVRDKRQRKDEE